MVLCSPDFTVRVPARHVNVCKSSHHTVESNPWACFDKQTVTLIESRYPSCLSPEVFFPSYPSLPLISYLLRV